jgi:hypothetical protein
MMQTRTIHRRAAIAAAVLVMSPLQGSASDKPAPVRMGERPPAEAWPASVHARYKLRYAGVEVGQLEVTSSNSGKNYSLSGTGKVSVLFGAVTWTGSSSVSGTIEGGTPVPSSYAFDWSNRKKSGAIKMRYKDRTAEKIDVAPPPEPHPDVVPLKPAHKSGALDPISAVLMLTKADGRAPCDRRVNVFDGKNRYDIVLSYKRTMRIPSATPGDTAELAQVCRAVYEPIAGHRDNDTTRKNAANRDVEVVMRRVPGSELLIPYSVTVPTAWGTGSMVTERIDVTTQSVGKVAMGK